MPSLCHRVLKTLFDRAILICVLTLLCYPVLLRGEKATDRRLIARIDPVYPEALQKLYIGGIVRLELTIGTDGHVEKVMVLGGNPILGQSAVTAVKKWRYTPAKSRSVMEVRIAFNPRR